MGVLVTWGPLSFPVEGLVVNEGAVTVGSCFTMQKIQMRQQTHQYDSSWAQAVGQLEESQQALVEGLAAGYFGCNRLEIQALPGVSFLRF
jgi:hypothetical protein